MEISTKLNMAFGDKKEDASHCKSYVVRDVRNIDVDSVICSINYGNTPSDYESASEIIKDWASAANDETGYEMTFWIS